jgi:glycosyltransferase involved in cell wall biosynthesis
MVPLKRPVVLFVLQWSLRYVGGVNRVVTQLAQHMRDDGAYEPLVLIADWDASAPVYEEIHGVRTVRWQLRAPPRGAGLKPRLAYALWERRFRKQFAAFCRKHGIQAINVHYPGDLAFTFERLLRPLAARIPLLLSFHGSDALKLADLMASDKAAWRGLLARCNAVVVCSQAVGNRIESALAGPIRHHVIYSGVDAGKFPAREPQAVPDRPVILCVGRFDHNKGQDILIDAFARIAADFPEAMLHLVGDCDSISNLDSLRAQVEHLNLGGRIRFFVDIPFTDIPAYFARAGIFVLASRQEAFGLVLLEAGSCALPVVASRVGGIPELIEDGVSGLLVAPEDAAALAQALRTLLADPVAAVQLGRRLAERVAADFSWTQTRACYEELIRDTVLVACKPPSAAR